jgi:hypothetical protein
MTFVKHPLGKMTLGKMTFSQMSRHPLFLDFLCNYVDAQEANLLAIP